MTANRLKRLPEGILAHLRRERLARGWSQRELGERVGLPQEHISAIETGRVAPRFDTLSDIVRTLEWDLILVPRALTPAVQALVRDFGRDEPGARDSSSEGNQALYAADVDTGGDEDDLSEFGDGD